MLTLSLLLMAGGATSLLLGFDIVVTDRGMAMVLSGVTALSAGVLGVGIALLIRIAERMAADLAARPAGAEPARRFRPRVPLAEESASGVPAAPAVVAAAAAGGAALAAARAADPAEPELPLPPPREPPTVADFEKALHRALLEEPPAATLEPSPAPPEPVTAWPAPAGPEPVPAPAAVPDPAAEDAALFAEEAPPPVAPAAGEAMEPPAAPPVAPAPPSPAVIGRYSAGGRDFVTYADGSIEIAGDNPLRFASVDDLRRHLAETRAGS
jgi:hypothetical protein